MSTTTQLTIPLPVPQPGAEPEGTLADRLCRLLEQRGRPLEVGHVASQLLHLTRCPVRLQRRLVGEIIERDGRLAWIGRDLVGLAPAGWHTAPVDEASFCIVDIETTGGSPGRGRVTEIGAVRMRGLQPVERFETLVDPGRPIPDSIRSLTGITDEMVAGKPLIDEAIVSFAEFAGTDVLVAHNAPFDLRFLNYERRKADGRYFTQPWLDTLVLARRLLNGRAGGHDLATLSRWAGTRVRPIHRALPDAEATAELLAAFLDMLRERGVDTLARIVSMAGLRGARHAYKLALAEDLPTDPGVYLMRDRAGEALYVGKATNLRRRVRSYFGPSGKHSRLIGRALESLDRVDYEVCGSDFEALLRESSLLRELRPPCNRRGLGTAGRYLKLTTKEELPRLYVTGRVAEDGADYFGPIRSDRLARDAVAVINELFGLRLCHPVCRPGAPGAPACAGPCRGGDPSGYRAAADEAAMLLAGDATALGALGPRIAVALGDGRLPPGDDGAQAIRTVLGTLAALARVKRAAARSAVLVEQGSSPGSAVAFFVGAGRVIGSEQLTRRRWRAASREALAEVRRIEADAVALDRSELEEALIVEDRLRDIGRSSRVVRLAPGWREDDALEGVRHAVRTVIPDVGGRAAA